MQKKIKCGKCGERKPDHNRVKLVVDGKVAFVCSECIDSERETMLADENHPAWQYYDAIKKALFGDEPMQ